MAGAALSLRKDDGDRPYTIITEECQDVLSRLVCLEPRELCSEAIIEKCRATRDLRSCGRIVEHTLTSCNHASLCAECVQRCDVCPICRAPIRVHRTLMRKRLYEECCEAGLISSRPGDTRDREGHLNTDVQRLWSFFDVALEYKLVSVICHYVSDVCMDDRAVSSNATVSLLLDGTIVKDWCRRTLSRIIWGLHDIYGLGTTQMRSKGGHMEMFATRLLGLSQVLESLEDPSLDATSEPMLELQQLIEGTHRVSQHLDVMLWSARHKFLEDLQSSHSSISDWRMAVKRRKLSAANRVWAEHTQNAALDMTSTSTLFIEDAMSNVGFGKDDESSATWENLELGCLRQAAPSTPFRRREGIAGGQSSVRGPTALYPPESVRAAVDMIFLEASSDLFLAKKAIFLYYLFDRHWPNHHNEDLKHMLDDYIVTFDISRHAMLESLVFFLLDEVDDAALEEACSLLPEVVSQDIHPKVARVLLERQKPFVALDVLRCSNGDGSLRLSESGDKDEPPHLQDAVTAVRVRLECGLLTDAYLYQRTYISRVKAQAIKDAVSNSKRAHKDDSRNWFCEMEWLVYEICWLCIKKNLVARMIELPWDKDEEKVLLRCLLEQATRDPCSSAGSLMVMFYIMRCCNQEAYLVHKRLLTIERTFLDEGGDIEKGEIIKSICAQRSILVEKGVELLPKIQQEQLRSGNLDQLLLPSTEGKETGFERLNSDPMLRGVQVELRSSADPASTPFDAMGDLPVSHAVSTELGWGNYRQPSILHGKPFRAVSGGSDVLSQLDVATLSGNTQKGYAEGLLSPILGKKLLYSTENELTPFTMRNLQTAFPQDAKGNTRDESRKLLFTPKVPLNSKDNSFNAVPVPYIDKQEPNLQEDDRRRFINESLQNGASFLAENGPGTAQPLSRWSENGAVEKRESSRNGKMSELTSGDAKYRSRRQALHASPNGKRKVQDQLDDYTQSIPADDLIIGNSLKMPGSEQQKGLLSLGADIKSSYTRRKNGSRWRTGDDNVDLPPVSVSSGRVKSLNCW